MLVADFYAPYVGGVEQHVRSLAHGLAARDHDVTVVTTAVDRSQVGGSDDGPVRVERIPTLSARLTGLHASADRPWAPPLPDPLATLHLRRLIRRDRPEVVHGHDWLGRSASLWCRRRGPALVVTQHYFTRACARKDLWQVDRPCPGPGLRRCLRCAATTYGTARAVPVVAGTWLGARLDDRVAEVTVAVSRATATGNRTPPGYEVVPNLLAPGSALGAGDADAPGLDALGLPDGPFLAFVGDLRPTKGFQVLLEAYARLVDPPPLVVVGERDRSSPEELPPGVVHIGTVPNELVVPLLARSALVVVPSVWAEPFGIVAIEAMQAGRPVVASATGGLAELVDHGRTGLQVPAGDPIALAQAVEELLADTEGAERMGRAGRAAVERFAPDAVVGRIEALYERAARR